MSSRDDKTYQEKKSAMDKDLKDLVDATSDNKDSFSATMEDFKQLFDKFLKQEFLGDDSSTISWDKIRPPSKIVNYDECDRNLNEERIKTLLSGLVVLKLNGGLGTTMGCTGPKSVIKVRGEDSFLELVIKQLQFLNEKYSVDVPLVLMNSFNTEEETNQILPNYQNGKVTIKSFNQKQYPRFTKKEFKPVPKNGNKSAQNNNEWFPPGHGDVYDSFYKSPLYKELKAQGKKYIFISNIDNLGATVDLSIIDHLEKNKIEFAMEVTPKSLADVKGGTLIDYEGKVKLLEIAQVPKEYVEEFKSIEKFKVFNTNNLYVALDAIEKNLDKFGNVELIVNHKVHEGVDIIQLETASGASIQMFENAVGFQVPRSRFLPVKTCSDLMLVQSDLYDLKEDMTLSKHSKRGDKENPLIELGDEFKFVNDYLSRVPKGVPSIVDLNKLKVSGDVKFGANVVLKGDVNIKADKGKNIEVRDGSVLDNENLSA
ncbi:UTP-glucose-1-phosphate uridylyltransferase [Acrasis kona]|uniref:UTP--glucose-1-phosphate uridylyltransferase n=1 Tax=Acrasis kona TaxID=1008807 RepID=A0AAW2ZL98_9EUKA